MAEVDVSDTLKATFHERCLAAVSRGIGMAAIKGSVTYEIAVNEDCLASFFRGDYVTDQNGKHTILWWGLILNEDNKITKSIEQEPLDTIERPTVASEEVMKRYLLEDLRTMFAPKLAESILLNRIYSDIQAEKLGLFDVTADDVHDAINTMDALIAAHDAE